MFDKPLCYFYSFNILSLLSLISFVIFLINERLYGVGMGLLFILPPYYLTTFLIFIIIFIIERIFSLEIKNKFITKNIFISVLRYTGLLIWLVPLVYFLNMLIVLEFFD